MTGTNFILHAPVDIDSATGGAGYFALPCHVADVISLLRRAQNDVGSPKVSGHLSVRDEG